MIDLLQAQGIMLTPASELGSSTMKDNERKGVKRERPDTLTQRKKVKTDVAVRIYALWVSDGM